jgi:hypothetical protein
MQPKSIVVVTGSQSIAISGYFNPPPLGRDEKIDSTCVRPRRTSVLWAYESISIGDAEQRSIEFILVFGFDRAMLEGEPEPRRLRPKPSGFELFDNSDGEIPKRVEWPNRWSRD